MANRRLGGMGSPQRGNRNFGQPNRQPFQGNNVSPWQGGSGNMSHNPMNQGLLSQLTSNPQQLALALTSLLQPQQMNPPPLLSLNTAGYQDRNRFVGNRGNRNFGRPEPYNKQNQRNGGGNWRPMDNNRNNRNNQPQRQQQGNQNRNKPQQGNRNQGGSSNKNQKPEDKKKTDEKTTVKKPKKDEMDVDESKGDEVSSTVGDNTPVKKYPPQLTYGPPLDEDLSLGWECYLRDGLNVKTKTKIFKSFDFPSNCKMLEAPLLNKSVIKNLTKRDLKRDRLLHSLQNEVGKGLARMGLALTQLLGTKQNAEETEDSKQIKLETTEVQEKEKVQEKEEVQEKKEDAAEKNVKESEGTQINPEEPEKNLEMDTDQNEEEKAEPNSDEQNCITTESEQNIKVKTESEQNVEERDAEPEEKVEQNETVKALVTAGKLLCNVHNRITSFRRNEMKDVILKNNQNFTFSSKRDNFLFGADYEERCKAEAEVRKAQLRAKRNLRQLEFKKQMQQEKLKAINRQKAMTNRYKQARQNRQRNQNFQ